MGQKTKMGKRMDEDSLRTLLMSPQDAKTSVKCNQMDENTEKTLSLKEFSQLSRFNCELSLNEYGYISNFIDGSMYVVRSLMSPSLSFSNFLFSVINILLFAIAKLPLVWFTFVI